MDRVAKQEAGPMARVKFPGLVRNLAAVFKMDNDTMSQSKIGA